MRIRALQHGELISSKLAGTVYLTPQYWDDWFKFETLFAVDYIDESWQRHDIGLTKIGRFGLRPGPSGSGGDGVRTPNLPASFQTLGKEFFSLGQDPSFYLNLTAIGADFRERFLQALNDLAYDTELLERAQREEVTRVSLLRDVPLPSVRGQLARLARGGERLTRYRFPLCARAKDISPITLDIDVDPDSSPPSNLHVLIGRNGVGKSTYLFNLANTLVQQSRTKDGGSDIAVTQLSNVVSVSFSAFDAFEPVAPRQDRTEGLTYHYVGLKHIREEGVAPEGGGTAFGVSAQTKDNAELELEMASSTQVCLQGARRDRWLAALRLLEADPIFAEAGLSELIETGDESDDYIVDEVRILFGRFSSGHKIVLLTITRLVETVEEKSLVLLDEPEAHLHPPLLSAFIRSVSNLLNDRNGIAVIATHSPVVLQEVPRSCAWQLQRSGTEATVRRLRIETFGENVGTLTDEVFGLEVTSTGFHYLLQKAAASHSGYEEALESFGRQLGAEGRAILRAMTKMHRGHVES
ncbi:ATP-binding protein [Nocardia higoensis]|uniref:ATP-binding protein n=1 Tax=Nocardia higoensis TaxID=228599 RepID=A0ABS0DIE2_9NOCA|nr:AAA family ATPase [Nocardia higoensis]MBF6357905.1 ATP-binding protein [Nocardia higoensis]